MLLLDVKRIQCRYQQKILDISKSLTLRAEVFGFS
ncbi:unnamed protein product [Brassica napus]|uniref:(rape) hypothetical protein n=1 Tax=Brassica napus TaxID=3708 RepID=A0A816K2I3_BRANA|nr:unnamed protein product [Brassica napus]